MRLTSELTSRLTSGTGVNFEFISGTGVNFEEFNLEINVKAVSLKLTSSLTSRLTSSLTLMLTSELTLKLTSGTGVNFEFNVWGKRRG